MALWCRDLKTATLTVGSTPKRVTLVLPFYENHEFLKVQTGMWLAWSPQILGHVEVVVVDDGSPKPLEPLHSEQVRIRQFRIDVDVRWNWLAARNIGAHHAAGE